MAGQFVIKQIAQEVVSEVNQPLYIGGKLADGSDAKITVASNGNVSTATPLTVPSLTVNSKPVMSSLLAEYTVTGSAVTSIDFSGLDINTHKSYRIEFQWYNPAGTGSACSLFVNGDTTVSNYMCQYINITGTSTYYSLTSDSYIADLATGNSNMAFISVGLSFGMLFAESIYTNKLSSSYMDFSKKNLTHKTTLSNITQLTFTAQIANSIGVGSTIRLYRGDV